ncbi:phospholipid-binding protein MlaC [uncultured Lamprocystis sp.]|uniref:MlaC/ttg2D family ABC transporter substrate-binding protein n=1 Tax=uncultured Lamprocystis sp. TaxID=543132 RepID=UPI0025D322F8|nr:ABC transporter substrate-binding protein [uncultured Lamprocystis sp.]
MKRRYRLAPVLLLGLAGGLAAQVPGVAPPAAPASWSVPGSQQLAPGQRPPTERARAPLMQATLTLKEGIDQLRAFLGQPELPNKLQVAAFLDREIAPYFDFDYMAKWVAGPGYARLSESERKALAGRIESSFLTALAGQLAGYQGQQVRMLRPRMGARGAVSVNVGIARPGAYPSRLEFRMYQSGQADQGWKVYDVIANGRSVASYYRGQFQRTAGSGQAVGR